MKITAKRAFIAIMIFAMFMGVMPPFDMHTVALGTSTTVFAGGTGEADDPYLIRTKEQLSAIRTAEFWGNNVYN